jgi:hypothetical protein
MRPLVISLIAALAALSLTGCSPVPAGHVAVGVDDDGNPVLVMHSCEGPARGITVRAERDSAYSSPTSVVLLDLENAEPAASDPAAVSLVDLPSGWDIREGAANFAEGYLYTAFATPRNDNDEMETLTGVDFRVEWLAGIGAGEVLVNEGPEDYMIQPVGDFMRDSREWCADSHPVG